MQAIRIKTTPVNSRVTVDLPSEMDGEEVEVIILASEKTSDKKKSFRKPSPELADTIISDDLTAPAVPTQEWDAMQ